ncbi:TolC family protein [candidate division KSB1 bacterium]|nr:TolC family protein [candidate division KSB1 bacterium]NIR72856.1 TolC family protein [candidate division KSB1 bacterium]NIS23755.1 TolC family protein [candidate division KSB1 bacterium]NIT70676.1 TolC family protein [candidate division KSB1 bacterium]NIU24405.1 TolC family protein [candidate division KSB1 bacterium]
MKISHFIWLYVLLLHLNLIQIGLSQENGKTVRLDELVREALENNPEIKSAESRWRAALQRPSQVSMLPDPMLSYTRFAQSVETRVGPQENVFTLSQRIPFPGKLGLKGKMADQEAVASEQRYEATKRDVIFKVKRAYYDLYWVDRSLEILSEYLAVLQDFTRVAEQKYATGQGIQANVLKSQVEISTIMERRLGFEKIRQGVVARINALLNRSQDTKLGKAATIDTTRVRISEADLVDYALEQREELQSLQAMIDKSEHMRSLAKREYLPDFNLQANYIDVSRGVSQAPDAGKNAWSVMVGLNLPIWIGKRNAAVREASELISSNRLAYENLQNRVKSEIKDYYYQLQITGKTLNLYEQGLITQAESSLESALASYQTGKLDFLNLLDAERMLLNLNLGYVKERSNYQKHLADLERALGGELPQ